VGCRLCHNICPVENCIEMVEVPSGRPSVTWAELSQQEPEISENWAAMDAYRTRAGIKIH
jgi:dihydropyrimidine dehydrogenase (NAD+) subunit PreA